MTGLVLDGGDTFVRRRDQQNVADMAAMAAGYAYGTAGTAGATAAAAWTTTAANGYTNLTDGTVVTVSLNAAGGAGREITVTITKPHRNNFAGIVGMSSWNVTTTATVKAGWGNSVKGALPIIFNVDAFSVNGTGPGSEHTYSEPDPGSEDVPVDSTKFNWTMYCDDCNADSSTISSYLDASLSMAGVPDEVSLDDHISPLNAGSHATLYSDLSHWVGGEFPVPIVDDAGIMVGWAMLHVTGSVGGDTKQIRGYFVSPINPSSMTIVDSAPAGGHFGAYKVFLVN
jgi:hypothetical protein